MRDFSRPELGYTRHEVAESGVYRILRDYMLRSMADVRAGKLSKARTLRMWQAVREENNERGRPTDLYDELIPELEAIEEPKRPAPSWAFFNRPEFWPSSMTAIKET